MYWFSRRAGYALAGVAVSAALGVRLSLFPILGTHSPYLPFILAVTVAARYGGRGPGFAATAISALGVGWFSLEPIHSFRIAEPADLAGITLFVVVGCLISLLVGYLRESLYLTALGEKAIQRKAQLVDLSHDAIITMDSARRITGWNAGAAEMYGWLESEVLGKSIHDVLRTSGHISTAEIDERLARSNRWDGELKHRARDGRQVVVDSRQALLRDDTRTPAGILEVDRDITKRRQAEVESRRAAEQRCSALESANMGTWSLDFSGGPAFQDERCCSLFGIRGGGSETSVNSLDRVHPDDRSRIDEAIQRAISPASNGKYDEEFRIVWADGSVHWVRSIASASFEGDGPARHALCLTGTVQDIAARIQIEEALRESEERLRLAQKAAGIGTFDWNIQTGVHRWTPELEAMYGLQPGGFGGTWEAWAQLIHPDDRTAALRRVGLALENGGYEAEWRVPRPDGSSSWLIERATVFNDESGKPLRLIGVNLDISERKRAEETALLAAEQRRLAAEAANMGLWEYHLDTHSVSFDDRWGNLHGVSAESKIGYEELAARFHSDDRKAEREALKRALADGSDGIYDREYRIIWADGSVHWVASHGRTFFEGEGDRRRAVRFLGVSREVTERKHAEERLRQTQKLESIGLLASGVAHDFNNLLTVIIGSASSALVECPSSENSQAILASAKRAADLTKQLLAYAGKGQAVVQAVEITELVSQSKRLLANFVPKRVNFSFNLTNDLPCVEADSSQIEQVLMNLVTNAGEAISPRGDAQIEIATSVCEITPEIARQQSRTNDIASGMYVCLAVRDNGAGMENATMQKIFDPFFSTKFTGRGLGLAAIEGIVRSNKGFIDVHSAPGVGTTFRVYLPACEKILPTEVSRTAPRRQTTGPATILVVDDEELVRKLACITLRRHGYEALEARDGRDALQVLADAAVLPSVVLLDLAMPVMDGNELAPILAQKYPGMKVIVSSGYLVEEGKDFPEGSIAGLLQKPYTGLALADKIREALCVRPAQGEVIEMQRKRA
jgi:two-component system, cell cycle sensor histidine kinase and response regulator CckA